MMFDSITRTRAQFLWERGLQGNGVRVGVVGTGVDLNHPDFADAKIRALSLVGGDVEDRTQHDTGVVWVIHRIAPAAEITVIKAQQNENGSIYDMIESCEKLREFHVDIVNLSMATTWASDGTDPLSREADYLAQQGIVVVAAAGNGGPKKSTIGAPGVAKLAITVGKVNSRNYVTRDSSRGPTTDGRLKPDLVAPGEDIVAAVPLATKVRYGIYTCTSFSTPHVTGVLALLKQAFPHATPALLKQALLQSCDPGMTAFSLHLEPHVCGAGLLNAEKAYDWLKEHAK
jgi:serine protease AprX